MRGEEGQPLRLAAAAALLLLLAVAGWAITRSRGSRSGQPVHAASAQTLPAVMAASATGPGCIESRFHHVANGAKSPSTINLTLGSQNQQRRRSEGSRATRFALDGDRAGRNRCRQECGPVPVAKDAPRPTTVAEADLAAPDPAEALKNSAAPVPQAVANPTPIFPFVAIPVSQGVSGRTPHPQGRSHLSGRSALAAHRGCRQARCFSGGRRERARGDDHKRSAAACQGSRAGRQAVALPALPTQWKAGIHAQPDYNSVQVAVEKTGVRRDSIPGGPCRATSGSFPATA